MAKKGILSIVAGLIFCGFSVFAKASEEREEKTGAEAVNEMIMHHVLDDHVWHFFDGPYGTWYLPVILYCPSQGLETFSSAHFYDANHQPVEYEGYILDHNHIRRVNSKERVVDLSITKNVAMLFFTTIVLLLMLVPTARKYKAGNIMGPRGLQALLEPIVVFVVDEVIKPNAGPHYRRYTPYLLTLFFFILIGNILGLLPGAGNLTGNIAVTMTLALFTFFITNFSGNKNYWGHVLWTPDVPLLLRPIILAVEIIGIFTKPFALMIRLFAAITAGHIVILSLLSMAFIFHSYVVGAGISIFLILINLVELLVAAIQAYVFTLFSSLYFGLATAQHEH